MIRSRTRTTLLFVTLIGALSAAILPGCQADKREMNPPLAEYRERMLAEQRPADEAQSEDAERADRRTRETIQLVGSQSQETERASLLTEPNGDDRPSIEEILDQVPDPSEADEIFAKRHEKIKNSAREARVVNQHLLVIEHAKQYLKELTRPKQVELGLAECIRRAVENNYAIRRESYGPAISRTQLVEAESAFDAIFFLDGQYSSQDRQTTSGLEGAQSNFRSYSGGIRKLLPTGMQVQVSVKQQRTYSELTQITSQFTTLNPSYDTAFTASFTQPLLRGFGLDYNRAGVEISRLNLDISRETFIQNIRDTLLNVEQAYWGLVYERRNAMAQAETVGQNWVTYNSMMERQSHDATPVELNNSKSRWQSRRVSFLESVKNVRDAEDRLKNLMNDPDFLLSDDVEIIPTETPFAAPLAIDHFAEVRTALDRRSEIRQAKLSIEQSRIQTARAKNETLPQLDLAFQYDVQGVGSNPDNSLDHMSTSRFLSYSVSVQFSQAIGNRGPRAALRRARMQESQAVVTVSQTIDAVVAEVNAAIRQMMVRYQQIPPQYDAVIAADNNLRAFQARAEQVSPSYLETELSAVEQLANTRRVLLQVITEYNTAIVQLEKTKGTLLEFNNVVISDDASER